MIFLGLGYASGYVRIQNFGRLLVISHRKGINLNNSGGVSAIYSVALPFVHLHHLTFMVSSRSVVTSKLQKRYGPVNGVMKSFQGSWIRLPWHTKSTRIVIVDCPELPDIAHVCKVCRLSTYAELPFAILTEMTKISKILPFVYTKSSQIVVKIRRLTTRLVFSSIACKTLILRTLKTHTKIKLKSKN